MTRTFNCRSFLLITAIAALAVSVGAGQTPQRGTTGARGATGRNVPLTPAPIVVPSPVPLVPVMPADVSPAVSNPEASISGIVVRGGTREGLRGAKVTLFPAARAGLDELVGADGLDDELDSKRTVTTEIDGRFSFPSVPEGRYTLIARRDGFVRQSFGQRGASALGASLVIGVGQTVDDITLQMRPAPAISGVITTSAREPLAAVLVHAYRLRYTPFGRELRLIQTAMTNDRGEYRLFWLDPGDYYVAATYSEQGALNLPVELTPNPNISKPDDVYSGLFFPGMTHWADAQAVRVEAADVSGINMTWTDSGRARVRGQVRGGDSGANAKITLLLPDGNPVPGFSRPHRADAEGRFSLSVFPGEYVLLVEGDDGRHFSDVTPLRVPPRGVDEMSVPLKLGLLLGAVVGGAGGLEGVTLKLCRLGPPNLRKGCYGNYSYPLRGKPEFKPFFVPIDDFEVFLFLPDGHFLNTAPILKQRPFMVVGPEEPPGSCDRVPGGCPKVSLAEKGLTAFDLVALSRGDVPDEPFGSCEIAPLVNVCLVFSVGRQGFPINGRVRNRTGEGVPGAQVILVPQPTRPSGLRPPNRYFAVSADILGLFEFSNVPEGLYTAFAFEEIEPGAYYAPDFLQRHAQRGAQLDPGAATLNAGRRGAPGSEPLLNLRIISRDETGP